MPTVIGDDGLGGIIDPQLLGEDEVVMEDLIEFRGMSDLVAHDMRKLMDRNIQEHIKIIVFFVLVLEAEVDFFLIDGVTLVPLKELEVLDFLVQRGEGVLDNL